MTLFIDSSAELQSKINSAEKEMMVLRDQVVLSEEDVTRLREQRAEKEESYKTTIDVSGLKFIYLLIDYNIVIHSLRNKLIN